MVKKREGEVHRVETLDLKRCLGVLRDQGRSFKGIEFK
jgi:hypothetical protein